MSRRRFSWDRFTDYHLIMAFAFLLAIAGSAVVVMVFRSGDIGPGLKAAACGLWAGATGLAGWAMIVRYLEKKRRASLNRAVDSELAGKWDPGFARMIGAYDKPWYLLCGETSVGKTAALRAANLPLVLGPDGQSLTDANQGKNGTFMFDWWFFENAVVLDSAGDMIENPDQRWIAFLQHVRDARPIQPINGMVLAISSIDLLGSPDVLRRKAELLARQVEVARNELRVRFPLYLLVTKSDLVTGFSDYFPATADLRSSFQIVGWSNTQDPRVDDRVTTPQEVRAGLQELVENLRERRTSRVRRGFTTRETAQHRIDHLDEMFAFPHAVSGMLAGLEDLVTQFVDRFGNHSPPFLRGIYFTSALQTGQALDFELQKALGLEQLPQSRRGASDRAFFIRDLFLDKMIPEAGMVTPLEDVVSTARRRGRVLVGGTLAAAAALLVSTALGYMQTAGRTRPHRELWGQFAGNVESGNFNDLALFDAAGAYAGNRRTKDGQTLLQLHQNAVRLGAENMSNWLLPLSTGLNAARVSTAESLFRDLVFLPSLRPASRMPGDSSSGQVKLLCSILQVLDAKSPPPRVSDLLTLAIESAKFGLSGSRADPAHLQATAVSELLRQGAGMAGADADATLTEEQRNAIIGASQNALAAWIAARQSDVDAVVKNNQPLLLAVRELADYENEQFLSKDRLLIPSVDGTVDPAARLHDLDSKKQLVDSVTALWEAPSVDRHAITEKTGPLGSALAATLDAPVDLQNVRDVINAGGREVNLIDLKMAMSNFDQALAAAREKLCAAAGYTAPAAEPDSHAKLELDLNEFYRKHLGAGMARPRIVERYDCYREVIRAIQDWQADSLGAAASGPYPHPFFKLPGVLKAFDADFRGQQDYIKHESALMPIDASPATRPETALQRQFETICSRTVADAFASRRIRALDAAMVNKLHIWSTTDAEVNGKTEADFTIKIAAGKYFVSQLTYSNDVAPKVFSEWVNAMEWANGEFSDNDLASRNDLKISLDTIKTNLQTYGMKCCTAWHDAVGALKKPNLASWKDVQGFKIDDARARIDASFMDALHTPFQALKALAEQRLFSDVSDSALAELTPLKNTSAPAFAEPICAFLHGWDFQGAVETRTKLLKTPATLDARLNLATPLLAPNAASAADIFWSSLLDQAVNVLVADARPAVRSAMLSLSNSTANKFPLCDGAENWADENIDVLMSQIDFVLPVGSQDLRHPMSEKIRDVQVIDKPWDDYLGWLRRMNGFLKKESPQNDLLKKDAGHWELRFSKYNKVGPWSAVFLQQVGVDPAPRINLTDNPRRFLVKSGGNLLGGFIVSLRDSGEDNAAITATIKDVDLAAPWAVLRLAMKNPDGQIPPIPLLETPLVHPGGSSIVLTINFEGNPLPQGTIPPRVPDVSN
ncbi:MAG TPA: type VI secretion protein IcmF/TssM N-terminal domain-containing protein [Tepidisphaeraceae bacterium]|jgi:hypothetical protein|nr:type VI secretion protein IcmF/TssM N-terminal domain-containing protein [Tepidisphaeraceae bacterium]